MEQYLERIRQFQDILTYMGYWDSIQSNWDLIMTAVSVAVIVFAVLNCFWGYQMMRLWMSLLGLMTGAIAGCVFTMRISDSKNMIFVIAVVCGMLVAMLANLIYRVGLIILCGGVVFITFELLFPVAAFGVHMSFVALGIVAGIAAFEYEDLVVTWVTGLCGGLAAARMLLTLLGVDNVFAAIGVGAAVAALGIRYQYGKMRHDPDITKRQSKLRAKRGG